MVPAGGAHIIRPSIAHAAHFAGIDYAEAVTGFDFVKNKASARVSGIVVAQENVEGLLCVWEGMMERVTDEEERLRVKAIMERWRKFLLGMQIKGRLDATHGKIEGVDEGMIESEEDGGGFMQDVVQPVRDFDPCIRYESQSPTTTTEARRNGLLETDIPLSNDKNGSFSWARNVDESRFRGFVRGGEHPSTSKNIEQKTSESDVEMDGGGFVPEEDSEGGGFLPPEESEEGDNNEDDFVYEDEDGIL